MCYISISVSLLSPRDEEREGAGWNQHIGAMAHQRKFHLVMTVRADRLCSEDHVLQRMDKAFHLCPALLCSARRTHGQQCAIVWALRWHPSPGVKPTLWTDLVIVCQCQHKLDSNLSLLLCSGHLGAFDWFFWAVILILQCTVIQFRNCFPMCSYSITFTNQNLLISSEMVSHEFWAL